MNTAPSHAFHFHPRVTFADTNVVGNVYYLNFFRWQKEALDTWLQSEHPSVWSGLGRGHLRLLFTRWSCRFEDPFGATLGDSISVALDCEMEPECDSRVAATAERLMRGESLSVRAETCRDSDVNMARLTTGAWICRIVSNCSTIETTPLDDGEDGACYRMRVTSPIDRDLNALDLLAWQGTCRELFLEDHAPGILHAVASHQLILQTTNASIEWPGHLPPRGHSIDVEMRLQALKCGQMGVRFDYRCDAIHRLAPFAVGLQSMSSKHPVGESIAPCPLPTELVLALRAYTDSPRLRAKIEDILRFAESESAVAVPR